MNVSKSSRYLFLTASLVAFGVSTLVGVSEASAQYFGGPAFGSRLSITIGGSAWGAPPVFAAPPILAPPVFAPPAFGRFAPAYPAPFAFPSRYMARRQAMIDRYSSVYAIPPVAPVLPVAPLPPFGSTYVTPSASASVSTRLSFDPYAENVVPQDSLGEPFREPNIQYGDEAGAFAAAASRLSDALSRRENGEVWIEYLQCDRLAASASVGQLPSSVELENLAARYQGVLANPDLVWLQSSDGFYETMAGLNAITGAENPTRDQPASAPSRNQPTAAPEPGNARDNTESPSVPSQNLDGESILDSSSTEELPAPNPETQSL